MLAKFKLNIIEVLISKSLVDSNISHDGFVLINNVPKEYEEMKKKNYKFKDLIKFIEDFTLFIKQCYQRYYHIV